MKPTDEQLDLFAASGIITRTGYSIVAPPPRPPAPPPPPQPPDNTPTTRADQIFARFVTFHKANPLVWRVYQQIALESIAAGHKQCGAQSIIERIRWHEDMQTTGGSVKINNDFAGYYARLFVAHYPQHASCFQLRRRLSAERDAYDTDIAVFNSGPTGDERALMDALRKL